MKTQATSTSHAQSPSYRRFSIPQRVEHVVLILTFTTLALTGLPQKFVGNPFAEWMIEILGGIEVVRIIHRISAIGIVLQSVYHFIVLGYKIWVRRTEMTMLPGLKDLTDAIDVVRYNLGLSKDHPKMPRYNFGEKVEYWAMIWGTLIMALTGFMLWNPIAAARFLPGQAIPAAKAAHGAEAILAVLAILIWHFYNVHLKSFNKSMFNGKMSLHQMEEEHGAELEQIEAGDLRPEPDPVGIRHRERLYVPIAAVLGLLFGLGLLWFATFEETAIATVPPVSTQVPVFSPLPPTAEPTAAPQIMASSIPHAIKGQEQCDTCHGLSGVKPFPADHEGRPNESCTICHQPGPTPEPGATTESGGAPGAAAAIPANHDLTSDTYKECTNCHGEGKMKPYPANHTSFAVDGCTICHKQAGGAATGGPSAGGPSTIPANHDLTAATYKDCTTCHGEGKLKPYPANHSSFAVDACTGCHQPAGAATGGAATSGGATGGATAIPANHDLTNDLFKNCAMCHATGAVSPYPSNHESFPQDGCTACHQQAK